MTNSSTKLLLLTQRFSGGVELEDLRDQKLRYLKGTTTVGLVCEDGVVLATDTRATMDYEIASKKARKIYKITDNIAFTTAGGVADTQRLVDVMRAEAGYYLMREGIPMDVHACARLVANIMNAYSFFPYIAHLLIGGVDRKGPKLLFVSMDGGLAEEKMLATGSGSPVAYGVLETEFSEGMNVNTALPIVIKAIKTAMKRDLATGNEVMVASVTRRGYFELSPEQIKKLI
ncbi:MAG: proteasome endopeptidase complex, archaeal, beta subunit [Hadesarchaea archaeon]|nr:MAG: proteasome endopeptidase complex, archaeal, beta subunit [Hadesarchaea archaeon]HDI12968.1 archaeal proteasome endopeptidase complex subunit beta [Hadesarchaea archaeon]